MKPIEVSVAEARRIAVRSQLLDGSATDLLTTVRRLGFLQIDPISSVAPPQYLVPWSRLGFYDRAELDRLLWEERKLVEWRAFIYPIEDLPLLQARMRLLPGTNGKAFLKENASFKRYVLPILRGDRLIGRVEPVWNRKTRELTVIGTWWEDGVKPVSLARPLRELSRWLAST